MTQQIPPPPDFYTLLEWISERRRAAANAGNLELTNTLDQLFTMVECEGKKLVAWLEYESKKYTDLYEQQIGLLSLFQDLERQAQGIVQ